MKYLAVCLVISGCTTLSDDQWLDSIDINSLGSVRKHSSSWLDLGTPEISIIPKLSPKVSIVSGALSLHTNADGKRDGTNPLLGLESGTIQCGYYDNSRLRKSTSYYCRSTWYKRQVGLIDAEFNSKVGAAYYTKGQGYSGYVLPMATIGVRKFIDNKSWIDLDYAPGELVNKAGVIGLTFGRYY